MVVKDDSKSELVVQSCYDSTVAQFYDLDKCNMLCSFPKTYNLETAILHFDHNIQPAMFVAS